MPKSCDDLKAALHAERVRLTEQIAEHAEHLHLYRGALQFCEYALKLIEIPEEPEPTKDA